MSQLLRSPTPAAVGADERDSAVLVHIELGRRRNLGKREDRPRIAGKRLQAGGGKVFFEVTVQRRGEHVGGNHAEIAAEYPLRFEVVGQSDARLEVVEVLL